MILHHFSSQPFEFNRNYEYRKAGAMKPKGFWLSDENAEQSWSKWCASEHFGTLNYKTSFRCRTADWLILNTTDGIRDLVRRFPHPSHGIDMIPDWDMIGQNFAGIVITPYCWRARFDVMWYYGWDCASACVWDLSTIDPICVDEFYQELPDSKA